MCLVKIGGGGVGRNSASDGGSSLRGRLNNAGAAHAAGAVLHDAQAHSTVSGCWTAQTSAVIGDGEQNCSFGGRQANRDVFGAAMLDAISDCLLGDAIEVSPCFGIFEQNRGRTVKRALQLEEFTGSRRQGLQG